MQPSAQTSYTAREVREREISDGLGVHTVAHNPPGGYGCVRRRAAVSPICAARLRLESGKPAQAIVGGTEVKDGQYP